MTKSELCALNARIRMAEHAYEYDRQILETCDPADTLRWEAIIQSRAESRGAFEALQGLRNLYLRNLPCVGRAVDRYGCYNRIYKVTNDG